MPASRSGRPTAITQRGDGQASKGGGFALPGLAHLSIGVRGSATSRPAGEAPGRPPYPPPAAADDSTRGLPDGACGTRRRTRRGRRQTARRTVSPIGLDDQAAQLETRQRPEDRRPRLAGRRDQLVDRAAARDQQIGHRPLDGRQRGQHRRDGPAAICHPRANRRVGPSARERIEQPEVLDELTDPRHDPCLRTCLPQERETAGHRRIVEAPGHDVQAAALLQRPRGGRQGPAPGAGLDDDGRVGESADDPVASWKGAAVRRRLRRELADHRAALGHDRPSQPAVGGRVQPQVAAADDGDGDPAGAEGRRVSGRIDPERQARDHRHVESGDRVGDPAAGRTPDGRRPAGADDGRGPRAFERAGRSGDVEHRWRQLDAAQPRRVVVVDQRDGPHARPVERGELPVGIGRCVRDGPRDRRRERRRAVVEPDGGGHEPGRAARRAGLPQDGARVAEGRDQPRERHGPDALDRVEHDPRVALAIVRVSRAQRRTADRSPPGPAAASRSTRHRCGPRPGASRRGARRPRVPRRASARRPHRHPVHRRPEAGGLVEMVGRDDLRAREVGDRPRDAEQPLGPAAGQPFALREGDRPRRGDVVEATDRPERASPDAPVRRLAGCDRVAAAGRPRCARPPARTTRARRGR